MALNRSLGVSAGMSLVETASYPSGAAQDAFIVPPSSFVSVKLSFELGAGIARVEYTNDPEAMIVAGTAQWESWTHGDVGVISSAVISGVTGVRCYRTSGEPRLAVSLGVAVFR